MKRSWLTWLCCSGFNAAAHSLCPVLLAAAAGPVATIRLPHALPFGLHGSWTSDYLGPAPGQVR